MKDFIENYAKPRKPVVIVNAVRRMGVAAKWNDFRHLVRVCGDRPAQLKRQKRQSGKWAGLEPIRGDNSTVREFLERIEADKTRGGYKGDYLFDWGLPKLCSELLDGQLTSSFFPSVTHWPVSYRPFFFKNTFFSRSVSPLGVSSSLLR